MTGFHAVVSSSGDVMRLAEESWPAAFPRRGSGWVLSECGRVAIHLDRGGPVNSAWGNSGGADSPRKFFRASRGEGPEFDVSVDLSDGELLVERGHIGRMGVFYFQAPGLTLVTSRLSDLLASVECRLDYGSALNYLSFGTPLPGHTLVDGVQALPAGHRLKLKPAALPVRTRVFDVLAHAEPAAPDAGGIAEIAAAVDQAIVRSSEGGGAALLLSAGIDSSYMAAVLGDRVEACYTSSFPDLENAGEFEEARRFSRITGHEHRAVPIRTRDARASLERVLNAEEPKSAWSTIVHDKLCRVIAANGHRRILSGLGADEIFGGYFHYARSFRRVWQQALRLDPAQVRNPLELILGSPRWYRERLFTGIPSFFRPDDLREAVLPPWRHWDPYQGSVHFYLDALSRKPDLHLFEAMIAHEAQHRIPDLLVRGFEAFSREHALSTAFPFLGRDVMTKGAALGADLRFSHDRTTGTTKNKLLWRSLASRRLPDFVMERPPSAYDAPIHDWFSDPAFLDIICDAIRLPSLLDLGLFSEAWLAAFVDDLRSRDRPDARESVRLAERAWALATFSAWQDRILDVR